MFELFEMKIQALNDEIDELVEHENILLRKIKFFKLIIKIKL